METEWTAWPELAGRACRLGAGAGGQDGPGDAGAVAVRFSGAGGAGRLHELLYCESCTRVLTRTPREVLEEIDSFYCPQSLDNLPSSEAAQFKNRSTRVFECESCGNLLSTHAATAAGVAALLGQPAPEGEEGDAPRYYLFCQHCRWDSLGVGFVGESPEALASKALTLEREEDERLAAPLQELTQRFLALEKQANVRPNSPALRRGAQGAKAALAGGVWRWKECEEDVARRAAEFSAVEELAPAVGEEVAPGPGLPARLDLRTKQSIRCRRCVDANLPNILVKPQINPLKGDSSMRTNVGAWFKKKSLAYDVLPRVIARMDAPGERLLLSLANPRDAPVQVTLDKGASWVQLDAYDEIEELDLFSSTRPPKGKPARADDPPQVVSRLANRVLLQLGAVELPATLPLRVRAAAAAASGPPDAAVADDAAAGAAPAAPAAAAEPFDVELTLELAVT